MQILSERMSWGKMQGTKPLQGARCKEGGGYRRNRDRPNDTPGRGLPWPRSMQAAWAANPKQQARFRTPADMWRWWAGGCRGAYMPDEIEGPLLTT